MKTKKKIITWDTIFFMFSTGIVAGIFTRFYPALDKIGLAGWVLALFWMMVSMGWRGYARAIREGHLVPYHIVHVGKEDVEKITKDLMMAKEIEEHIEKEQK